MTGQVLATRTTLWKAQTGLLRGQTTKPLAQTGKGAAGESVGKAVGKVAGKAAGKAVGETVGRGAGGAVGDRAAPDTTGVAPGLVRTVTVPETVPEGQTSEGQTSSDGADRARARAFVGRAATTRRVGTKRHCIQ